MNSYIMVLVLGVTLSAGCTSSSITITRSASTGAFTDLQKIGDLPSNEIPRQLYFITDQMGWLVTGKTLWLTENGGGSWKALYSGEPSWDSTASISNLHFINSMIGWMSEAVGGVYKTTDGGKTWRPLTSPFPDGTVYTIRFIDNGTEGWAGGVIEHAVPNADIQGFRKQDRGVIAHTTDAGLTWHQQVVPNTRIILNLYFYEEELGWALGWPALFRLERQTKTWEEVDFHRSGCATEILMRTLDNSNVVFEPVSIQFATPTHGWLAFRNGYMARTTDGGGTWCDLLNPADLWSETTWESFFREFYFSDLNTGWALGSERLYESEDGGVSWQQLDVGVEVDDIHFLGSTGWAVGRQGLFRIVR